MRQKTMYDNIELNGETYEVGDQVIMYERKNVREGDSRGVVGTETLDHEGEIVEIKDGYGGVYVHLDNGHSAPVEADEMHEGQMKLADLEHAD